MGLAVALGGVPGAVAAPVDEAFAERIEPLLEDYCFDCHGDGSRKGDFSMDEYRDLSAHLGDREHWMAIWKNVRSQIMPPADKMQPTAEERRELMRWIEREVFRLDPENPDPGRVTIRRLNRVEYEFTVRDLLGVEFDAAENFPPDDTGYGFDTVGEVLSISPLLMEKYVEAAEEITARALPKEALRVPEFQVGPEDLRQRGEERETGRHMEFERDHTVEAVRRVAHGGRHKVSLSFRVAGAMEATGNSATLVLLVEGREVAREHVGWDYRKEITMEAELDLEEGQRRFGVRLIPGDPPGEGEERLAVQVRALTVRGPLDGGWRAYPESYQAIFFDGPPKGDEASRRRYAAAILERLATRAYRRPVDQWTLGRLTDLAVAVAAEEGQGFEDGIRTALTAILASPRFLFRAEVQAEPDNPGKVVPLDEHALASRLSYFLWSSLPDAELMRLAGAGELRKNLKAQVERMLADPKARRFVTNFTGQWLQARDVEGMNIEAGKVLGISRGAGVRKFHPTLRRAMREETELVFLHALRENRPSTELLDADYTFLNERLAEFYGIEGVRGEEFRRVELGEDSVRGGLLTQGTFLVVTSNPTRTSPVKRGLFVLDNILGTPAPPAPPDVPELEEAEAHGGKDLSMRELMERHRREPLCKSCHKRMDPIGLALENFNPLGMWRDEEGGEPIDTAGELVTGETFNGIGELKKVLATGRRGDFHRCLTEKLMTYALGRGVEYFDAPVIDAIVAGAEKDGGGLRDLVVGVVESVPFQDRRGDGDALGE